MPMPMALEQQENVRFARTIRRYPCLYDYTNNKYSSRADTDAAWRDISTEFNAPVRECKIRWKNIRTVFRRHLFGSVGPAPKKEYYLSDELKFLLPSLRVSRKHRGDHSKFDDDEPEMSVMVEMEQNDTESDDPTASLAPSESPIPITDLQRAHTEDQDMLSDFDRSHKSRDLASEVVKPAYNYQPTVRSRSESDYGGGYGQDALADKSDELFLLSLKDDMRRMSSLQKRKFKRRIFDIIDEVMDKGERVPNGAQAEPTNEQLAQPSIVKVEENVF
ncbi:uncharacterized protein LOC109406682 [Aedes albopictus]|uniref:MADF domain-containing protein n=1 Tax=Aedes albopictus TaxID=7160 RepID=A0ABM2A139_AEDAL|nr:uncharacterized protein LOC109406682 [Aedes albopictus]